MHDVKLFLREKAGKVFHNCELCPNGRGDIVLLQNIII